MDRAAIENEAVELIRRALALVDRLEEKGIATDLQRALDELSGAQPPLTRSDVEQVLATPSAAALLDRITGVAR